MKAGRERPCSEHVKDFDVAGRHPEFKRIPRHIGVIPDGNRRWARERGLPPGEGYFAGLRQGFRMLAECRDLGVEEVTVYGFTHENTHRPAEQKEAFTAACVEFADASDENEVALRVIGDASSPAFPQELLPYTKRRIGQGVRINMLVNYGWEWDLRQAIVRGAQPEAKGVPLMQLLGSGDVPRIDLVLRWGGCQRLSGFLPVQTVYADYYFIPQYWPDYEPEQVYAALRWYEEQDITLGG